MNPQIDLEPTMKTSSTISPWTEQADRQSPDDQFVAAYKAMEMVESGCPTKGELRIKMSSGAEHLVADNAAASFIWSDDSRFLAFSKWRDDKKQSLCVLRMVDMIVDEAPVEFRILELKAFSNGKIEGVDSPAYMSLYFSLPYDGAGEAFNGAVAESRFGQIVQDNRLMKLSFPAIISAIFSIAILIPTGLFNLTFPFSWNDGDCLMGLWIVFFFGIPSLPIWLFGAYAPTLWIENDLTKKWLTRLAVAALVSAAVTVILGIALCLWGRGGWGNHYLVSHAHDFDKTWICPVAINPKAPLAERLKPMSVPN